MKLHILCTDHIGKTDMEGVAHSLFSRCWLPGLDGVHWPARPILGTQGKKYLPNAADAPWVPGHNLTASPGLSCTPQKGSFSSLDLTPDWVGSLQLPTVLPCPACWGEVDHRSLWSAPVLGWGYGRLRRSVCKASLVCAPGDGPMEWVFPHCVPSGMPRGSLLDTCLHQQHGAYQLALSGVTYNLLCWGDVSSGQNEQPPTHFQEEFLIIWELHARHCSKCLDMLTHLFS